MKCQHIEQLLTSYLLGDLDKSTSHVVKSHLAECAGCQASVRRLELTLDLVQDSLAATQAAPKRLGLRYRKRILGVQSHPVIHWFVSGHPDLARAAAILLVAAFVFAVMVPSMMKGRYLSADGVANEEKSLAEPGYYGGFGDESFAEADAPAEESPGQDYARPKGDTVEYEVIDEDGESMPVYVTSGSKSGSARAGTMGKGGARHGWKKEEVRARVDSVDYYNGESNVDADSTLQSAKVPILGDLPLTGRFARQKAKDDNGGGGGAGSAWYGKTLAEAGNTVDSDRKSRWEATPKPGPRSGEATTVNGTYEGGRKHNHRSAIREPVASGGWPEGIDRNISGNEVAQRRANGKRKPPERPAPPAMAPQRTATRPAKTPTVTDGRTVLDSLPDPRAARPTKQTAPLDTPVNGPRHEKKAQWSNTGGYAYGLQKGLPGSSVGGSEWSVRARVKESERLKSTHKLERAKADGAMPAAQDKRLSLYFKDSSGREQMHEYAGERQLEKEKKTTKADLGKLRIGSVVAADEKKSLRDPQIGRDALVDDELLEVTEVHYEDFAPTTVTTEAEAEDRVRGDIIVEIPDLTADEPEEDEKRGKDGDDTDEDDPRFKAVGVNPFVYTKANAFSTFGIDVDTASFTLARNYMKRGYLPPAESVRTEEFVNFFDYGYKPPKKDTFEVYTDCAPTPFGRGLNLLKIGVKGRRLGREEERNSVLTITIDTSGSMSSPDRFGLVRESLRMLLDGLDAQDRVAIVQYDSVARLVLDHTPASKKKQILDVVDSLQTSGPTNLERGLQKAYAVAHKGFVTGAANRVLLLSDGVANLGSAQSRQILDGVEKFRTQGIYCSVFGFGIGMYDDAMLEQLADKGNGSYAFIDSLTEAKRVFVDDLSATLNVIASDVKIQVQWNPELVTRYRQLGYENRQLKKEQFRDDTVDAGEVGSGQSVTALYELQFSGNEGTPGNDVMAIVRVRYRRTDTGDIEEIERTVRRGDAAPRFQDTDIHFQLAASVAEFAEILRGSPFARGSTFNDVSKVLGPVSLTLGLDGRVTEASDMAKAARGLPRGK